MTVALSFLRKLHQLREAMPADSAREVTLEVLRRIAEVKTPTLRLPRYRLAKVNTARLEGPIAAMAAQLSKYSLDVAAYHVSCVYSALCSAEKRYEFAMLFSPPLLARYVVKRAVETIGALEGNRGNNQRTGSAPAPESPSTDQVASSETGACHRNFRSLLATKYRHRRSAK